MRATRIYRDFKCSPHLPILSLVTQIPIFISMTMAVRNLLGSKFLGMQASLPKEGIQSEGLLWFEDLTAVDPTMITPIICGAFHLVNVELSEYLRSTWSPSIRKGFKSILIRIVLTI